MNPAPDTRPAGNGGDFDPQQAAALLDQTTAQARRQFAPSPPWLLAARAVAVLAALGAIWLTVRGQHPYTGPTGADIPILIAFIVLNFAATVTVREHARWPGYAATPGSARPRSPSWRCPGPPCPCSCGPCTPPGPASPCTPPPSCIIPGLAWAAVSGTRDGWPGSAMGLAIAATGVAGAFAGPAGSWAVAAVGLCAVLLGNAAAAARQQHRMTARP